LGCFLSYSPLAIANTFLTRHRGDRGIEHMKLQKLVYFTHGWWLALNNSSLINEKPQVWTHGPVFKSLYHTLKNFGHIPITEAQTRYPTEVPETVSGSNVTPTYIDFVWDKYGHLSSFALSSMTHKTGGAWSKLASEYDYKVPFDLEIPDEYVREEFLRLYNEEYAKSGEASST
jgi:uncharacterized phage-associated protein